MIFAQAFLSWIPAYVGCSLRHPSESHSSSLRDSAWLWKKLVSFEDQYITASSAVNPPIEPALTWIHA
jgi:hypothetical protein